MRKKSFTVSFGETFRNISNSWQNLPLLSPSTSERRCITPVGEVPRDPKCICTDDPCMCKHSYFTIRESLSSFQDDLHNLNMKSHSCTNVAELYNSELGRNSKSFENLASKLNEIFHYKPSQRKSFCTSRFRADKSPLRSPTKKSTINFGKSIFLSKMLKQSDLLRKTGSLTDLTGEGPGGTNALRPPSPLSPLPPSDNNLLKPCNKPCSGRNQSSLMLVRVLTILFFYSFFLCFLSVWWQSFIYPVRKTTRPQELVTSGW